MRKSPLNPGDKPLRRKTPMKQREPLKRSAQMERNSGLKPRSDDTAKVYREERAPLVARLLEEHPDCQAQLKNVCTGKSQDAHEIVSRARGGSITDPANILMVCRACHTFITDHPAVAEIMGFSKHSWERLTGEQEAS